MDQQQFQIAEFGGAPRGDTGWVSRDDAPPPSDATRGPVARADIGAPTESPSLHFSDAPRPARRGDLAVPISGAYARDVGSLPTYLRSYGGNPAADYTRVSPNQSSRDEHGVWWIQDESFYDLLDEMDDRDGAISASLDILVSQVLSREWTIDSSGGGSRGERIARITRDMLTESMTDWGWDYLREVLLRGAMVHGVSIVEIIWGKRGEWMAPARYMHRHPGQFSWSDAGDLRILKPRNWDGILAPLNKFVILRRPGRYANPWGDSLIHPLRFHYWFKRNATLAWAEATEVFGTPITVASLDRATLGTNFEEERARLETILESLRSNTGLCVDSGISIAHIERKGNELPHRAFIEWISRLEAQVILGASLTTQEAQYGTRAQADTQADTIDHKITGLVRLLRSALQTGVIAPFVRINFGESAPMPRLWIDEHVGDATNPDAYLRMIETAQKVGLEVSIAQVRDVTGLQQPDGDDDALVPPAKPVAPSPFAPAMPAEDAGDDDDDDGPDNGGGGAAATAEMPDEGQDAIEDSDVETDESSARRDADSFARSARDRAVDLVRDLAAISAGIMDDARGEMMATLRAWSESQRDADSPDFDLIETPVDAFKTLVETSRLIAMRDFVEQDAVAFDAKFAAGAEAEEIVGLFESASEWMVEREVMTVAEVRRLADAYASVSTATAAEIERAMRSDILALAGATDDAMTDLMRASLESTLSNGGTAATWFDEIDAAIQAGELPPLSDAYLDNVYRTETGNYYRANQDDILAQPGVRDLVWGYEYYNPADNSSDPTHAAMSGVKVKLGSPAEQAAAGGPPWRYMCRCVRMILTGSGHEETPDAASRISAISRFCDHHPRDDFAA